MRGGERQLITSRKHAAEQVDVQAGDAVEQVGVEAEGRGRRRRRRTYLAAWQPSHVVASLIRMRSLGMPRFL